MDHAILKRTSEKVQKAQEKERKNHSVVGGVIGLDR